MTQFTGYLLLFGLTAMTPAMLFLALVYGLVFKKRPGSPGSCLCGLNRPGDIRRFAGIDSVERIKIIQPRIVSRQLIPFQPSQRRLTGPLT